MTIKKLFLLIFAVAISVSALFVFTACDSSPGSGKVDLKGSVLEGYEDIPFETLIKRCCKLAEEDAEYDGEKISVNYRITNGWNTDKFKEDDVLLYMQKSVTCTIEMTGKVGGEFLIIKWDFYFAHDLSSHKFKVIGARYYATDAKDEYESFENRGGAMEELEDFLYYYERYIETETW